MNSSTMAAAERRAPSGDSGDAVAGRRWRQRGLRPARPPPLDELGLEEADELTVAGDELVERSGLDDPTTRQHDDPRCSSTALRRWPNSSVVLPRRC